MLDCHNNNDLIHVLRELAGIKYALSQRGEYSDETILDIIAESCDEAMSQFSQFDIEKCTPSPTYETEDIYTLSEIL